MYLKTSVMTSFWYLYCHFLTHKARHWATQHCTVFIYNFEQVFVCWVESLSEGFKGLKLCLEFRRKSFPLNQKNYDQFYVTTRTEMQL